jgi:hypothetical protein
VEQGVRDSRKLLLHNRACTLLVLLKGKVNRFARNVRHRQRPSGAKAPERKAADLNADADARRKDATVAEVMLLRHGKFEGRRRAANKTARSGLIAFMDAETRCRPGTYGPARRLAIDHDGCNFNPFSDILDWHVAAIINPLQVTRLG